MKWNRDEVMKNLKTLRQRRGPQRQGSTSNRQVNVNNSIPASSHDNYTCKCSMVSAYNKIPSQIVSVHPIGHAKKKRCSCSHLREPANIPIGRNKDTRRLCKKAASASSPPQRVDTSMHPALNSELPSRSHEDPCDAPRQYDVKTDH